MLPFAAAMVLLAARIWQAATPSANHVTRTQREEIPTP
jgi:hypothetical protein